MIGWMTLATSAKAVALEFEPSEMIHWRSEAFQGRTQYDLDRSGSKPAIAANCESSASGLFLRQHIDLRATPIIEWSWRVETVFDSSADERTKAGDDYPARLYVVKDGGLLPWRTRAINYVWSSRMPRGSNWPNAYAAQAHMIAVRSGVASAPDQWMTERRDIREDFRRYHGVDLESIDAIAIMTDCDDRATTAKAWYGGVRLLPDQKATDERN